MNTAFDPPRGLRNRHVQSVLSSSFLRRALFRRRRVQLERATVEHVLDCGNGVRLQGFHSVQSVLAQPRALVVLLHGWEGSAQSNYILHTGAHLLAEGCDVFRLNFRDHGQTHHLNRELFHSCRIEEVVGAVAEIAQRFPARPLVVGGFSLGGNFALRVALRAPAAGIPLTWAFAICPVISPRAGLAAIENAPWFYEFYFLRKWRDSLRRKQSLFPERELFAPDELRGGLRDLTRNLVERHTQFGTLENYLDGYSIAGDKLAALTIPASILTAADDPVIPVVDFHALKLSPSTELTIVPHGGHCGFIRDFSLRSWAEDFILAQLQRRLTAAPTPGPLPATEPR
ncbi:MAG: YheT family hydrolase [Rudaea sp.]